MTARQSEIFGGHRLNRFFIEQAPMAIAMVDTNMRYLAASKKWIVDYKLEEREIIGKSHYDLFPEIGDDWKEIHKKCLSGHIDTCPEARFDRADGSAQWIAWDVRPWREEDGKIGGLLMYTDDITNQKIAEEKLRLSEESFRGAFEHSAIGMALVSPKGEWIKVNRKICQIVGYSEAELVRLTFQDITHPDDLDKDLSLLTELSEGTKDSYQMEKRYFHKDGHIVWIILAVSIVRDSNGQPLHFVSQISDITSRKVAEQKLEAALSRLQAVLDGSTQVSMISTSVDGVITGFNKGAENMLGYNAEEMVGVHSPAIVHVKEEVEQRGDELSKEFSREIRGFDVFAEYARQGLFESREWTYVRKDGSTFPVQLVVTAIRNEKNEIDGFLGIGTDISERIANESKIEKYVETLKQKNKQLEEFTYITSHDLREPLNTIQSFLNIIYEDHGNNISSEMTELLGYIESSCGRMNSLIKGLLEYSRMDDKVEFKMVDLNKELGNVLQDLDSIITKTKTKITYGNLPNVWGNDIQLRILFQNLLSNSMKFKQENKQPEIQIGYKEIGKKIQFYVKDNGIGIDQKFHNRIFHIFQRLHAKDAYEGSGLGLANCQKIVSHHGGDIWVVSELGKGSTFYFTLNKN